MIFEFIDLQTNNLVDTTSDIPVGYSPKLGEYVQTPSNYLGQIHRIIYSGTLVKFLLIRIKLYQFATITDLVLAEYGTTPRAAFVELCKREQHANVLHQLSHRQSNQEAVDNHGYTFLHPWEDEDTVAVAYKEL